MAKLAKIDLSLKSIASDYSIQIGEDLLSSPTVFSPFTAFQQILIVSNETVSPLYLKQLKASLNKAIPAVQIHEHILADGEQYKSQQNFNELIDALIGRQYRRSDLLIALGGGVIGDLTGFTAACYQRGMPFLQIPTSLLAMVDSSVGGKTAINHPQGKNLIGAFHQPIGVITDVSCLQTLAKKEFNAGMAEVIKVAIIHDKNFFHWLLKNKKEINNLESTSLIHMINRSCQIKAEIVEQDEREKGLRATLNLGHTFAHALEKVMGFGEILHGEAVAIGISLASDLSVQMKLMTREDRNQILTALQEFDLPVELPKNLSAKQLVEAMRLDKKNTNNNLRFILPLGIGKVRIVKDFPVQQAEEFLSEYESD